MTDKTLPAPIHTPQSVLERVTSDLAISIGDLALCHPVDGAEELCLKLAGIAGCATRAVRDLRELERQGDFARIEAEAAQGEARDVRRRA